MYYVFDGSGQPVAQDTLTLPAKGVSVAVHPTTPGLVVVATTGPVLIFDVTKQDPAVTLNVPNGIGLWTVGWSHDGRLVAGVTKKGALHVWDPRASPDATQTRDLATQLQALKPIHLVWVGEDIFITSFSRTRSRQYSLLSGDGLATQFTVSLDTSQGPLLPVVDNERRIVYAAGRGDMTLRQIELSGPQGYQEMPHALPSALTSGLALAHWSTLPVMQARIGCVLVPTQDKDGDCIMPVQINVPRRQLIDYHDDLYPDESSGIPEQTAEQWLAGGDHRPLPTSLEPGRRKVWEEAVAAGKAKWSKSDGVARPSSKESGSTPSPQVIMNPARSVDRTKLTGLPRYEPQPAEGQKVPTPSSVQLTAVGSSSDPSSAVQLNAVAATANGEQVDIDTSSSSPVATRSGPGARPSAAPTGASSPQDGETASSTSYKVRIISDFLTKFHKDHKSAGKRGPLMVGLQGPQGCGKTTLCDALVGELKSQGLVAAVLSLDDLYRTYDGLKGIASQHPNNPLLSGRGPPGTHDIELATRVLSAVKEINDKGSEVELPIFDKSLCDGEGDRSKDTNKIKGPVDVFVLEGWSMGFSPLSTSDLEKRVEAKDGKYFTKHSAESLTDLNTYLTEVSEKVYPNFEALVQVEPDTYEHVFKWRLEQEHNMKKANGGRGMTDDQVRAFVERYMPAYELWAQTVLNADAPWAGKVVRLRYSKDREVVAVENPEPSQGTPERKKEVHAVAPSASTPEPQKPAPASTEEQASPKPTEAKVSPSVKEPEATPAASTKASQSVAKPTQSFHPDWSRKYLAGKTPLNPTYDQIPALATLHQDSCILKATPDLALFPIQGPGGRLCIQPLSMKGRVPNGGHGYLSGGVGLADFAADPYGTHIVLAGEDRVLRVWNIGPEGIEGPGPEPAKVIHGDHVDRIVQIGFHPTAKDLLLVASNDQGKAHLRFFDLSTGKEAKVVVLDTAGVTGFAVSPEGDRIAVATKDQQIIVLDGDSQIKGKAHDSPRSAQLAWAGDHLVSLGFARGSMRKINLYSIGDEVTTISTLSLDVSPSVLFPHYDPDTSILYVWGKGQQAITGFEIHPGSSEPIAKLPAFTGGSPQHAVAFLPKRLVDVKKVEVMKALRLTSRAVEEVSFNIPRNKPHFFQDDIYVPTIDTSSPAMTAAQWLAGERAPPRYISLQPEGLTPCK